MTRSGSVTIQLSISAPFFRCASGNTLCSHFTIALMCKSEWSLCVGSRLATFSPGIFNTGLFSTGLFRFFLLSITFLRLLSFPTWINRHRRRIDPLISKHLTQVLQIYFSRFICFIFLHLFLKNCPNFVGFFLCTVFSSYFQVDCLQPFSYLQFPVSYCWDWKPENPISNAMTKIRCGNSAGSVLYQLTLQLCHS